MEFGCHPNGSQRCNLNIINCSWEISWKWNSSLPLKSSGPVGRSVFAPKKMEFGSKSMAVATSVGSWKQKMLHQNSKNQNFLHTWKTCWEYFMPVILSSRMPTKPYHFCKWSQYDWLFIRRTSLSLNAVSLLVAWSAFKRNEGAQLSICKISGGKITGKII